VNTEEIYWFYKRWSVSSLAEGTVVIDELYAEYILSPFVVLTLTSSACVERLIERALFIACFETF